jgi:hypothetical protein
LQMVGNRTECALLLLNDYAWAPHGGGVAPYEAIRRAYELDLQHVYSFSSETKMSSAVLRLPGDEGGGLRCGRLARIQDAGSSA